MLRGVMKLPSVVKDILQKENLVENEEIIYYDNRQGRIEEMDDYEFVGVANVLFSDGKEVFLDYEICDNSL